MKCVLEDRIRFLEEGEKCGRDDTIIRVCGFEEWQRYVPCESAEDFMPKGLDAIRFCKAESVPDCTVVDLIIPVKNNPQQRKLSFVAMKNEIVFVDNSDFSSRIIKKIAEQKAFKNPGPEAFIYAFFEMLIYSDLIYIQELEDKITKLENLAIAGKIDDFEKKLSAERKNIFEFYRYYSQLLDIGQEFIENENDIYSPQKLASLRLFIDRVERMKDETAVLKENIKYVRDIYQSAINKKQNDTMNFLTGITTIFLPLSFIAGWYGMNFVHMPELKWPISYLLVFLVCIAVAGVVITWLRKKKFFK